MSRALSLWVLLATLLAPGCKPQQLTMEPGARTFTPESYPKVWAAWTREEESFAWKELAHEIFVSATFESWEFRWAYVVRYAYDYSLTPEARDEMLDAGYPEPGGDSYFCLSLKALSGTGVWCERLRRARLVERARELGGPDVFGAPVATTWMALLGL